MQRRLTACVPSWLRVMMYSMGPPRSGSLSAVNRTPVELMFLVNPPRVTRSAPERVIERGSRSLNRLVLRCSMNVNQILYGLQSQGQKTPCVIWAQRTTLGGFRG